MESRAWTSWLAGVFVATSVGIVAWVIARAALPAVSWTPDAVVIALVLGLGIRVCWTSSPRVEPGLAFMGREVLELAIILLGATTDLRRFLDAGTLVVLGVIATTVVALGAGIAIARRLGLTPTHSVLVASGNAICGNSAIAAVARVIGAPAGETASAIACTAVLSIGLVLALPLGAGLLGLPDAAFGALAGMTVYAVPQVLAATLPVSAQASEVGTVVKLIRVVLLAPWLLWLSRDVARGANLSASRQGLRKVLPGYLLLFLGLAMLRTAGLIPDAIARGAQVGAHALTVGAMAAVGLSTDPRVLRQVGLRTTAAAALSLLVLVVVAYVAIRLAGS